MLMILLLVTAIPSIGCTLTVYVTHFYHLFNHAHTHAHTHTRTHTRACTHTRIMHTCTHAHAHARTRTRTHAHAHAHAHAHTHIYLYKDIYMNQHMIQGCMLQHPGLSTEIKRFAFTLPQFITPYHLIEN